MSLVFIFIGYVIPSHYIHQLAKSAFSGGNFIITSNSGFGSTLNFQTVNDSGFLSVQLYLSLKHQHEERNDSKTEL